MRRMELRSSKSVLSVKLLFTLFLATPLLSIDTLAATPDCLDENRELLAINNAQVLEWKVSTPNQTLKRAHVSGKIVKIYPGKKSHQQFGIQIGDNPQDTLEVVYNVSFGKIKNLKGGEWVEACGDYITSSKATDRYQASPDGAIIHWVHQGPNSPKGHLSGFTVVDNVLYGYGQSSEE